MPKLVFSPKAKSLAVSFECTGDLVRVDYSCDLITDPEITTLAQGNDLESGEMPLPGPASDYDGKVISGTFSPHGKPRAQVLVTFTVFEKLAGLTNPIGGYKEHPIVLNKSGTLTYSDQFVLKAGPAT